MRQFSRVRLLSLNIWLLIHRNQKLSFEDVIIREMDKTKQNYIRMRSALRTYEMGNDSQSVFCLLGIRCS